MHCKSLFFTTLFLALACDKIESPYRNILLIIIDDMKDWTGYLGGYDGIVHTPAIDLHIPEQCRPVIPA